MSIPDQSLLEFDQIDLIQSITRECFWDFVREFWNTFIAEPLVPNWHMELMCDELQEVAERVFAGKPRDHDLIINIPPGSSKSSIGSILFNDWVWTRMPHARFIGGSYSAPVALDLALKSRDVAQSDLYRQCFPDVILRDDQMAKSYFRTTMGGSRYSVGVGGSVTGMHGHFLVIDDPIDPKQAISEAKLKAANAWMAETLPTRKVDKDIAVTILIMQRLSQDDCTENMIRRAIKDRPVRLIKIPGELTPNVQPARFKAFYKNGLMDPNRLSATTLEEYRKSLGPYGYAGQIEQEPIPRSGAMFKTDRITIDRPDCMMSRVVRYWDKAATPGGGCYTAGALMAKDVKGRFWILDMKRGQWGIHQRNNQIKQAVVADYNSYGALLKTWVEQEPGSGGLESAQNTIAQLAGYRVGADKVGKAEGDKIRRAEPFADQVEGGNVYMVPGEWNTEAIDELRFFPGSKYKDQVDAMSGAFNKLKKKIRAGGWPVHEQN